MSRARWLSLAWMAGFFLAAVAQVPQGTRLHSAGGRRPAMTSYRDTPEGKKLDFVISGSSVQNTGPQIIEVDDFDLKSFHNGNPKLTNFIAEAPHCEMDTSNNVASDPGPVQIFTPTTNLYVEGVGFRFTQSNHFLTISNAVKTRVVKALLKSSFLSSAGTTNTNAVAGQVVRIFSDHGQFDFDSNVVDYAGNVHLVDPQLDLTSDFLTIRFTTNGEVQSMLARQNVVLTTTNNGRATGLTGLYYKTNGEEIMKLTTDAAWRNGDQSARAHEFVYYSVRHFLTGSGDVHVLWPETNASNGVIGFRELYADYASMQFPPTNGPVQHIHAQGNVIIVNNVDQSRAMADQADYERKTDVVELTGHPDWWNNQVEVRARTLTANLAGKMYHARTDAHFKMRTAGAKAGQPAALPGQKTNQWIYISSDAIDYQTNQAVFFDRVETRVLQNERLQEKLNCDLLTLELTNNQMRAAYASGHVYGETAPDAAGVVKTIRCRQLNAYRSLQTSLMQHVDAFTNVIIEEYGIGLAAPSNKLAADTVIAYFSPATNQIEHAVALRHVVFDQFKAGQTTHATSDRADYTTGANDIVKLTGRPLAHNDKYNITDADFMVWLPKSNKFQAFGQYTIVPIKHSSTQKSL